jgi:hypothetical protein
MVPADEEGCRHRHGIRERVIMFRGDGNRAGMISE